jgi:hypothetical protein
VGGAFLDFRHPDGMEGGAQRQHENPVFFFLPSRLCVRFFLFHAKAQRHEDAGAMMPAI